MASPARLQYGGPRHTAWRRALNLFWLGTTAFCAVVLLAPLVAILAYLVAKGVSSFDWAFFAELPKPAGETGGGVANAIVGTILVISQAALFAVPLGIMAAVYIHEFSRNTRLGSLVRFMCDMLNSTPSIILGLFAYALVVAPMGRFSALAGSVALFVMMMPVVVRGTEEILRTVPDSIREASLALGASRWQTIRRVVLPAASTGITTTVALSVARISGETAPLLLTSLGNDFWSLRPDRPINTLPVQIYKFASSPYEDYHRQAWAAALLLVGMITLVNLVARLATAKRTGAAN